MNELVTVIVTVYNTCEYIRKCIDSVRSQTYQNLEIIIVDDGSTDGSSEICDQIKVEDARISVIHKENGGVVSARKAGLENAKGEYAIIIDSDDWMEEAMIFDLHKIAVENCADIVTSGYYRDNGDNVFAKCVDGLEEGVYQSKNDKEYFYRNFIAFEGNTDKVGITGSLWNKLIKTSLLKESHREMNTSVRHGEDVAIVYHCCAAAGTIAITHSVYYHYFVRAGSATFKSDSDYFSGVNSIYLFLRQEFEKNGYKVILLQQLEKLILRRILFGLSWLGMNWKATIPYYDFDKRIIEKNAKILLYGAGKVGQSYYKHIYADKLYKLTGWVDKNYLYYRELGMEVSEVKILEQLEYDYIILAFKYENMAVAVKMELLEEYKIDENKILWLPPTNIIDKYWLETD